jgi:hypothetical protein
MAAHKVISALAPQKSVLGAIRAAGRKNRKNKLSMQEIDREIRAYRAERSQTVSTSRS